MSLTDNSRVVVEMGVEELDFLGEFQEYLLACGHRSGAYTWGDVLEAYVRAREHYSLPGGVNLVIPQGLGAGPVGGTIRLRKSS